MRKHEKSAESGREKAAPKGSQAWGAAPFVCPVCRGPIFAQADCSSDRLKCTIGHSFTPESLSEAHREALEKALLTTLRLLHERRGIQKYFARRKSSENDSRVVERSAESATRDEVLLGEILDRL